MKWTEWILGCIYPRRCPICDDVVAINDPAVCEDCLQKLTVLEGLHCQKCGKFIQCEEEEYCDDCKRRNHYFDEGFGVLPYRDWAAESMLRFKYHKRKEYAQFFGELMVQQAKKRIERWKPNIVIPVPMNRKKKKRRGYDQAELLAAYVGKKFQIPVRYDCVVRTEDTTPQKDLDPQKRRENMRYAFQENRIVSIYQKVLLIDDIYTTGSTVDAIAERLKKAGVKKIYVLTACTGIET